MTQVTFKLTDDSKLQLILNWLQSQSSVKDIETKPTKLTRKQLKMKADLEESLEWVEKVSKGEIPHTDAFNLLKEMN